MTGVSGELFTGPGTPPILFIPKGRDEKMAVDSTWQVVCSQSYFGRYVENIFYVLDGNVMSISRAAQVGEMFVDWYTTFPSVSLSSEWSLNFVTVTSLQTGSPYEVITTEGLPLAGERTGAAEAVNVAMQITLYTGLTGRSFRGRHFLSGMLAEDRTGNEWEAAALLTWQNYYYSLQTALAVDDLSHVVLSRVSEGVERDPWVITPILSYLARARVADMGRRLDNA